MFQHLGDMLDTLPNDSPLGFLRYFPADHLLNGMEIPVTSEGLRPIGTSSYTARDSVIKTQFKKSFQEEHDNVPNLIVGNQKHEEAPTDVESELDKNKDMQVQNKSDLVKGQWTSEEDRFEFLYVSSPYFLINVLYFCSNIVHIGLGYLNTIIVELTD